MRTVLLDTHVLHWWSAEPDRVSDAGARALAAAEEIAVVDVTWYELAWLGAHGRIALTLPVGEWLARLSAQVRTVGVSPAAAAAAAALPASFPGDPADRMIYATAVAREWPLVTKDRRMHEHPAPRPVAIW